MTSFEKCWGIYMGKGLARTKPFPIYIPQHFSNLVILHTYLPMKMEQTERSETSAYKIHTPGNYPEESIQHSAHGKSLKWRICMTLFCKWATYLHLQRNAMLLCPTSFCYVTSPQRCFAVSSNVYFILAVLVWQFFGSYIFDLFVIYSFVHQ